MTNLFEHALKNYSVYPRILEYFYASEVAANPALVNEINQYDFVFIASDYADKIPGCTSIHMMTSADRTTDAVMWLQQDFSSVAQLPASEYTSVPVVGFVGRLPIFNTGIHAGFEDRCHAIQNLERSNEICTDFHIHTTPDGDSAGFWNKSRPDYKKNGPLFKTNMLACQYQLCTRGNANWSLRFYETLAYGRIPIYVDSGGKFPLNQEISPADMPFVYCRNVDVIEDKILEFHSNLPDEYYPVINALPKCQEDCRRFYDEHFSQETQIRLFDDIFLPWELGRGDK